MTGLVPAAMSSPLGIGEPLAGSIHKRPSLPWNTMAGPPVPSSKNTSPTDGLVPGATPNVQLC